MLQERTASNFRNLPGHPAAHWETRPTGDTGESPQDEDERGRMIVGQQDSMSFTSAGTRKGSWIPGDYRPRGGQCLSRSWRVEVSAVAFSSLRHTVLTPFPRVESLATLCHRRCSETFEVFWTLRLSGCGGLRGNPPSLHGSWVDQPEVPQFAWFFSFGMRLACPLRLLVLSGLARVFSPTSVLLRRCFSAHSGVALSSWRWPC